MKTILRTKQTGCGFQARQRAAIDSEFTAFNPEDVIALDARYETLPRDRDGLFAMMMDRLDDLAHDLTHHDFTIRRTVGRIPEESEMQRYLSRSIADRANGIYVVTREEEVADNKHTDIRLSATNRDLKAVIEVKIADKWTLANLERALRCQLVEQYLRHSNCRTGCLLLTYHGRKTCWVQSETKKRIPFSELVAHLNNKARAIENESAHGNPHCGIRPRPHGSTAGVGPSRGLLNSRSWPLLTCSR